MDEYEGGKRRYNYEVNKANALALRRKSLEKYYENPIKCRTCGTIIIVLSKQRVADVKNKKFCTRSCAATYNNQKFPKRQREVIFGTCEECSKTIKYKRCPGGGYSKRRFCSACLVKVKIRHGKKVNGENALPKLLYKMTVGEVEAIKGRLQTRTMITKNSKKTYKASDRPKQCEICGFQIYQVCHKKPVASFPKDTLIGEINALSNLIGLCPNHHALLDNGLLSLLKKESTV